jgi:hypothetical protein
MLSGDILLLADVRSTLGPHRRHRKRPIMKALTRAQPRGNVLFPRVSLILEYYTLKCATL